MMSKNILKQGRSDCGECRGVGLVGPDGTACDCVRIGGGRAAENAELLKAALRMIDVINRDGLPVGRDSLDVAQAYLRLTKKSASSLRALERIESYLRTMLPTHDEGCDCARCETMKAAREAIEDE